jgi:hypothetical protein
VCERMRQKAQGKTGAKGRRKLQDRLGTYEISCILLSVKNIRAIPANSCKIYYKLNTTQYGNSTLR